MYDDSELIAISPRDGLWEVNGIFPLTLEEALDYVGQEMRVWKPEPEVVTVRTKEQMEQDAMFAEMGRRFAESVLPVFAKNPYAELFAGKPFEYDAKGPG